MTTSLLTPWWRQRREAEAHDGEAAGSTEPTAILDWRSSAVRALVNEVGSADGRRELLQRAHGLIATRVLPVYGVDDAQPVSRTLARGRGSCSQRLAVLEAVARSSGVATRSRGLLVDGRFWYPRFRRLRFAVPDAVILAWPEFRLEGGWVSASQLFGPPRSGEATDGFTNADGETLFDALARGAVDWDGVTSSPGTCSSCDLSARVLRDLGRFDSRDELFARHGQTLCWPARTLVEPALSRWGAGVTAGGLTYAEVGATAGDLPPGYDHVLRTALLGQGAEVFRRASEAVMTWDLHHKAGLTVDAAGQPVELGADVRIGWSAGPIQLTAPCRVVRVVDEADTRGFAYGTLAGHPERGEESFTVRLDPAGAVTLEIVSFSRPALWWSRLGAPAARLVQRRTTTRYLDALVDR